MDIKPPRIFPRYCDIMFIATYFSYIENNHMKDSVKFERIIESIEIFASYRYAHYLFTF